MSQSAYQPTLEIDYPSEGERVSGSGYTIRLGCDDPQTMQLGSPFDYQKLVQFIVDRTMPEPTHPEYEDELAARVLHHVRETDGGAFVLFTSFRTLDAVAERIIDTLVEDGHPMHVQGTGVPRNTLIERFRADEAGCRQQGDRNFALQERSAFSPTIRRFQPKAISGVSSPMIRVRRLPTRLPPIAS